MTSPQSTTALHSNTNCLLVVTAAAIFSMVHKHNDDGDATETVLCVAAAAAAGVCELCYGGC